MYVVLMSPSRITVSEPGSTRAPGRSTDVGRYDTGTQGPPRVVTLNRASLLSVVPVERTSSASELNGRLSVSAMPHTSPSNSSSPAMRQYVGCSASTVKSSSPGTLFQPVADVDERRDHDEVARPRRRSPPRRR